MDNYFDFNIIERAVDFILKKHGEQPGLDEIAASVNLSRTHFEKLLKKWTGINPEDFLHFITTEYAKRCLLNGFSLTQSAYGCSESSGNVRLHDSFLKFVTCSPDDFEKRKKGIRIKYDCINSPFGLALVSETNVGICGLSFIDQTSDPVKLLRKDFPEAIFIKGLDRHGTAVQKYFSNRKVPENKIIIDIKGTTFQIEVWKALLLIPSAQLVSYKNIASLINKPAAIRAVGTAIGANPIAYLIPCHRVVRQSGHLGGYRWGSGRKTAMIAYEAIKTGSIDAYLY